MESTTPSPRPRHGYHNLMMTLLVAGVGVLVFDRAPSGSALSVPSAQAAPPEEDSSDPSGRISAADQRKQIIGELRSLNPQVGQLEATIKKGIKVTEMPQQKDAGAAPTKAN